MIEFVYRQSRIVGGKRVFSRLAQEVLGHSDANLAAKIYTDVPALTLYAEFAKLPWIGGARDGALIGAQKSGVSCPVVSLADILRQLQVLAQATGTEGISHSVALPGTPGQCLKWLPGLGSNQCAELLQLIINRVVGDSGGSGGARNGAQIPPELAEVVAAWGSLAPEIRSAILTLARTAKGGAK